MANVIAVVWDFDKTLVDGYMENPIFEEYGVNPSDFWKEVEELPARYWTEQRVRVNPDTVYLNHMLKYVRDGKFKGLNNKKLEELGQRLKFYNGVPDIMPRLKRILDKPEYQEYGIILEHYIVSTGLSCMIRGSAVMPYVAQVWGCEFIQHKDATGHEEIAEIGYTMDNTGKTRALFEINKGMPANDEMSANTVLPEELRRVHFINMIYIADGPSDIPAFSVVNKNDGATFAIYPRGSLRALKQVEQLRMDGRINMYAEADYSEGSTANMWLCNKVEQFAERILEEERSRIRKFTALPQPKHLI